MKNTYYLLLLGLFLVSSCIKQEKNFEDYFPKMTVSAESLADGSVKIKATIIEGGSLPIDQAGFAFSDESNFTIDINQVIVTEMSSNSFEAILAPNFDPTKTYYFKAWVTNQLGFVESNVVSISNIEAEPVDGPCTYDDGYLFMYGNSENIYSISPWNSGTLFEKSIDVHSSYTNATFTFYGIPNTGVYTTTQNSSPNQGEVRVGLINTFSGFINTSLNPGHSVFVNRTSANSWTVEVCSAEWTYNSYNFTFSTYFSF